MAALGRFRQLQQLSQGQLSGLFLLSAKRTWTESKIWIGWLSASKAIFQMESRSRDRMRPWTKLSVLLFLATWASAGTMIAQPSRGKKPALDFSGTVTTEGTGENTAFARSVSARYGGGMSVAEIMADAASQGFKCNSEEASCTRTRVDQPCVEAWIVDFSPEGAASGRHVRRCMGGELDE
jgi:hypothetical protein